MARVTVTYSGGEKKSYASPEAAKADMQSRGYTTYNDKVTGGGAGTKINTGSSGSSGGGGADSGQAAARNAALPAPDYSGFSLKGLFSTDPANVARNQQAAARYAIQDYQRQGTPIPSNLRDEVNQIIASGTMPGVPKSGPQPAQTIGGYTGLRDMFDGGGAGKSGATFEGGGALSAAANAVGLKPMAPVGTRLADGALFLGGDTAWNDYTRRLEAADASVSAIRQSPSPGPNEFPGLGAPGKPRESNGGFGETGLMGAMAPSAAPAQTENKIDSTTAGGGNGNAQAEDGAAVSAMNAKRSQVPQYEQGGMVGPGGVPQRPSTAMLDLPPSLARLLNMPMQSYAEGGMVGPGGIPQRPMTSSMAMGVGQQGGAPVVGMAPPGGQGRPLNFAAIDQQAQQFMQKNPQQVAQIKAEVEKSMAEGEIDAQGLNMFVQVATTALQNPDMWPQLRQVLIRQGMLDAEDIGEEYDQGFLIILYIIGKTMGTGPMTTPSPAGGMPTMEGEAAPMSAGQPPEMSMSKGGPLPAKSKNPDGSIPINAHEGEYVIPADVTRKLGTDHFDKMIAKARGMDGKGEQ